MTPRYSRRRAMQAAVAAAAVTTFPRSKTSAQQATPAVVDGASIAADQVEPALAKLDGLLEEAMARTGVPGAAVAVVYERAFGVREAGKPEPVTPETVFQLASLSKSAFQNRVTTWQT